MSQSHRDGAGSDMALDILIVIYYGAGSDMALRHEPQGNGYSQVL